LGGENFNIINSWLHGLRRAGAWWRHYPPRFHKGGNGNGGALL